MSTITTIIVIALSIAVGMLLEHFLPSYFKRKGENKADKEDSAELAYLEEKGKNLATKEDVAALTETIESVKQEVSFANQRQHNIIEARNKCLFEILECAANLDNYKSLLLVYSRNLSMRDRLIELLQQTNQTINLAIKDSNYCLMTYGSTEDLHMVASLADTIRKHGGEIVVLITNTLTLMDNINNQIELYKQTKDIAIGNQTLAMKNELLDESKYTHYEYADSLNSAINEYILFLRRLYRTDSLLKYRV